MKQDRQYLLDLQAFIEAKNHIDDAQELYDRLRQEIRYQKSLNPDRIENSFLHNLLETQDKEAEEWKNDKTITNYRIFKEHFERDVFWALKDAQ